MDRFVHRPMHSLNWINVKRTRLFFLSFLFCFCSISPAHLYRYFSVHCVNSMVYSLCFCFVYFSIITIGGNPCICFFIGIICCCWTKTVHKQWLISNTHAHIDSKFQERKKKNQQNSLANCHCIFEHCILTGL